jgi:peptide-methionine (S)-S-oxide reductase
VFALNENQRQLAEASRTDVAQRRAQPVHTAVETAGTFHPAEDYHQKYLLRRARALFDDLRANYASETELLASTPAARINGYLGCNGYLVDLEREVDSFGLSAQGREQLLAYVKNSCKVPAGPTCPAPQ